MYKEIHPYYRDSAMESSDVMTGAVRNPTDYYKPGDPVVLRLDTIRQIRRQRDYDPAIKNDRHCGFSRLVVSDDYLQDIIVRTEEADEITKALVKDSSGNLAKEVSSLTTAVRDLWNLLRARMH